MCCCRDVSGSRRREKLLQWQCSLRSLVFASVKTIFKSVKMLSRVKKVVMHEHALVQDAVNVYKSPTISAAKPTEIKIVGSQVVDLGEQFFCQLI